MKLELNPKAVAAQIVAEVDRKGSGLSTQHEQQLNDYIAKKLSSFGVVEPAKKKEGK